MTTTVLVTHKGPDHHDVMVETHNPKTGEPAYGTRRLKSGESTEVYVHSGSALRVFEIDKVVEPTQ